MMTNLLGRLWRVGIVRTFLTGLFFILPIALTIMIVAWLITKVQAVLGPDTWLGSALLAGGSAIIGPHHQQVAFWLGALIALASIWLLGFLVRSRARHLLDRIVDGVFDRLPVFRTIHGPVAQVVSLLRGAGSEDVSGMSVVLCQFGQTKGVSALALLTSQAIYELEQGACHLVYLPTSPLPASGGLAFVPVGSVTPVPEMDVDGLMRIYFSLGALSQQVMPARFVADVDGGSNR